MRRLVLSCITSALLLGMAVPSAQAGTFPGLYPRLDPIAPVPVSVRSGAVTDPTLRLRIEAVGRTDTAARVRGCLVYFFLPVSCRTQTLSVGPTVTTQQRALTGGRISPLVPAGGAVWVEVNPRSPVFYPYAAQATGRRFVLRYR